jgi:hypothetical protein
MSSIVARQVEGVHVHQCQLGLLAPTIYRVAMMIATKKGATTAATTVMMIGQKARGLENFVVID